MPVSGQADVNLRFDSTLKKFVPIHITAEPHIISEIPGQPGRFGIRLIEFPLRASVDGVDPVTSTVPNPPITISGYSLVSTAPAADEFFPDFFFEDGPVRNRTSVIYFHSSQNGNSVNVEYYGGGAANSAEAIAALVALSLGDFSADAVKKNLFINGDFHFWRRYGGGDSPQSFGSDTLGSGGIFGPDRYLCRAKDVLVTTQRIDSSPTFLQSGAVTKKAQRINIGLSDENSWILVENMINEGFRYLNGSLTRTFWIRASSTGTIAAYLMSYNREAAYIKSELINISTANAWLKRTVTFDLTELSLAAWDEGIRLGFVIRTHAEEGEFTPLDTDSISEHYDEEFNPLTTASVLATEENSPGGAASVWEDGSTIDFAQDSLITGDQPLAIFKLQSEIEHADERELCERYFETMYPDSIFPGSDSPSDYDGYVVTLPTTTPDNVASVFIPFKKSMFDFLPGFPLGEQLERIKIYAPDGTENQVHSYPGGNVAATVIEVTQFGFTIGVDAAVAAGGGLVNFYWTADKEYAMKEEL